MSLVHAAMARRDREAVHTGPAEEVSKRTNFNASAGRAARLAQHEDEWLGSVKEAVASLDEASPGESGVAPAQNDWQSSGPDSPAITPAERAATQCLTSSDSQADGSRELLDRLQAELRAEQQLLGSVLQKIETEQATQVGAAEQGSGLGADLRSQLAELERHRAVTAALHRRVEQRATDLTNPFGIEPDGRG
jgi:hypothetical protein